MKIPNLSYGHTAMTSIESCYTIWLFSSGTAQCALVGTTQVSGNRSVHDRIDSNDSKIEKVRHRGDQRRVGNHTWLESRVEDKLIGNDHCDVDREQYGHSEEALVARCRHCLVIGARLRKMLCDTSGSAAGRLGGVGDAVPTLATAICDAHPDESVHEECAWNGQPEGSDGVELVEVE